MPNSLTEIRVWLDIFETKLGIASHSEPNYFIVKALHKRGKVSVISDKDLIMFCHLLLILLTEINASFILCV